MANIDKLAEKSADASQYDYAIKTPKTPERKHQSSSHESSRNDHKLDKSIPTTPPSSHRVHPAFDQSPTGTYATSTSSIIPPTTPSNHSTNRFKLSNVPQTPYSSNDNDSHETPLKSPSQFRERDEEEAVDKNSGTSNITKPQIRQISSTLKTRLSYAFVKFQNGWANQSLDELEKTVINDGKRDTTDPFKVSNLENNGSQPLLSPSHKSSKSPSKVTKPIKSPTRTKITDRSRIINNHDEQNDGSANVAFLQAMSKARSSPKRKANLPQKLETASLNAAYNPEADAIESLMSLSSPQSFKPKLDYTSSGNNIPRQRLSFGDKISPQKSSHDAAIETESDTEYEESSNESDVYFKGEPSQSSSSKDLAIKKPLTQNRGDIDEDDDNKTASESED